MAVAEVRQCGGTIGPMEAVGGLPPEFARPGPAARLSGATVTELIDLRDDDGGLSGGTMERPALKRLLGGHPAGKVQTVVVYKVDRLTRSLSDFAKIVDIFDAHNASFVSVTQQFNTTTSMGRLTLNMLLSFAQFDRKRPRETLRPFGPLTAAELHDAVLA